MPKDITLTVLIKVGTSPLQAKAEHQRYKVGDIIQARLSNTIATKVGSDYILGGGGALLSPNMVYVHVTDVPNDKAAKAQRLQDPEIALTAAGQPGGEDPGDYTVRRLHRYRLSKSSIPLAARQKLLADGEITVTWAQAKGHIRKKKVIDDMDSKMDTESVLVDGDLT